MCPGGWDKCSGRLDKFPRRVGQLSKVGRTNVRELGSISRGVGQLSLCGWKKCPGEIWTNFCFLVKSIYISESTHKVSRSNNNFEPLN